MEDQNIFIRTENIVGQQNENDEIITTKEIKEL